MLIFRLTTATVVNTHIVVYVLVTNGIRKYSSLNDAAIMIYHNRNLYHNFIPQVKVSRKVFEEMTSEADAARKPSLSEEGERD